VIFLKDFLQGASIVLKRVSRLSTAIGRNVPYPSPRFRSRSTVRL